MPNDTHDSLVIYTHQQIAAFDTAAADRFRAASQGFVGTPIQQIQLLNRYWRRQLTTLNVDTIDAREALLDNITQLEWTRLFKQHVLPLIIDHHLPAA